MAHNGEHATEGEPSSAVAATIGTILAIIVLFTLVLIPWGGATDKVINYLSLHEEVPTASGIPVKPPWVTRMGTPSSPVSPSNDIERSIGVRFPQDVVPSGQVFAQPDKHMGKKVQVSGEVERILGPRTFILDAVLVVDIRPRVARFDVLQAMQVVVEGTVQKWNGKTKQAAMSYVDESTFPQDYDKGYALIVGPKLPVSH